MVDGSGDCVGVTVYNLVASALFNVGDVLTIPEPWLMHTTIQEEVSQAAIFIVSPLSLLTAVVYSYYFSFSNLLLLCKQKFLYFGNMGLELMQAGPV